MMKNNSLWTLSGARLTPIHPEKTQKFSSKTFNWVFLPGGPGLGSESLHDLTRILTLPGNLWLLDLPGDGSNCIENDPMAFSRWQVGLLEAISTLESVILVAHSTGGMYALSTPDLEKSLSGLVLIDSAPDASWQLNFIEYLKSHPIPAEAECLQALYDENPSNELLRDLTVSAIPYLSTEDCPPESFDFLKHLPYNYRATQWSAEHFDQTYQALWIPRHIPTLILAGEKDHLTPLSLFTLKDDFQCDSITMKEISHAGHYPWIENPAQVAQVFKDYIEKLISKI